MSDSTIKLSDLSADELRELLMFLAAGKLLVSAKNVDFWRKHRRNKPPISAGLEEMARAQNERNNA